MTLASVPGAATATAERTVSAASAEAASAARREALTVRIDTERRGRWGRIDIRVREADDREPAQRVQACLQMRRWGGWRTVDCERTDWRGRADWSVRAGRHHAYRIYIPESWRYYPYYSDRFRIRSDRDWWDNGHDWNGDNDHDWRDDNGRNHNGRNHDRRR
ncbi:hypothetical protein [Actinocorallia populi]|uniref:hypothetical protein n=1 Tax=Actinocorallia populi TaxID=2079200 RepID=UPI001300A26D|nr:hypothetical protein [Actinocorallia populi]